MITVIKKSFKQSIEILDGKKRFMMRLKPIDFLIRSCCVSRGLIRSVQ